MSIENTYANLEAALVAHIREIHGSSAFVPHWVMVAGVHNMNNPALSTVQTSYAIDAPEYALSGLLDWAKIEFVPVLVENEEEEE